MHFTMFFLCQLRHQIVSTVTEGADPSPKGVGSDTLSLKECGYRHSPSKGVYTDTVLTKCWVIDTIPQQYVCVCGLRMSPKGVWFVLIPVPKVRVLILSSSVV